jgi:hypothetical protein
MEQIPDSVEGITEIEKDTEVTARILGALGLVDATLFDYESPTHDDSRWIVRGED